MKPPLEVGNNFASHIVEKERKIAAYVQLLKLFALKPFQLVLPLYYAQKIGKNDALKS